MEFEPDGEDAFCRNKMRDFADEHDWVSMQRMRDEVRRLHAEQYSINFYRELAARGWIGLSLPKPHGQGASFVQSFLFAEELETQGFTGYALTMNQRIGGMLLRGANAALIEQHMPHVLDGSWLYCSGLSEPGAGSDLLSLKTRAVRDGDHYVVNGSKLWTSAAHISDWCTLLVRTDPAGTRHRGLSVLLVDLKLPGIEIQPVWVMGGWRVNAVFYDNVRVPVGNLVGRENEGWDIITGNLDEERAMSFGGTETRLLAARLIRRLEERAADLSETDLETLGRFVMDLEADRLLYLRVGLAAGRGEDTSGIGPESKVHGSELAQRFAQWAADVLGQETLFPGEREKGSVLLGDIEQQLRTATVATVIGGTSEVQRNIVARRVLELPKSY